MNRPGSDRHRLCALVVLTLMAIYAAGCIGQPAKLRSTEKTAESLSDVASIRRAEDISAALQQLLMQPPFEVDEAQLPAGDIDEHDVPTSESLACDGSRYTLLIDDSVGHAWILRTGGLGSHLEELSGPWSTECKAVRDLQSQLAENVSTRHPEEQRSEAK